jgi:phosphatidylinositol alpha-1,6-mannosyltransferase
MRRLRKVLAAFCQVQEYPLYCLSLVDAGEERELCSYPTQYGRFEGCGRKKSVFVLKAARHVITRRDAVAVVGHIGQAPVAWAFQKLGFIRSYVLVLHGIEAWEKVPWLDRRAARAAACIVATTQYTAREFSVHNRIPPDRMRVIPLALEEETLEVPVSARKTNADLSILTVGRFLIAERYKGVDTLIEATRKARNAGAPVSLLVAGDGDDAPRLNELTSRLGLDRYVTFVGAVSNDNLQQLYAECDVFAMPSKGEGFGIVFLEAMSHAKVCIGGNHGGTPEVISHGVDGYLVNHGDVDQLARCLIELCHNPALRSQMGLKAYEKVKARYVFPHMRVNWFHLLKEVIRK